jgi:hypothetical protein
VGVGGQFGGWRCGGGGGIEVGLGSRLEVNKNSKFLTFFSHSFVILPHFVSFTFCSECRELVVLFCIIMEIFLLCFAESVTNNEKFPYKKPVGVCVVFLLVL